MKVTVVKYGRTVEVGKFGHGRRSGRVWFGWEAEVDNDDGETYEAVMIKLKSLADNQEIEEHRAFNKSQDRRESPYNEKDENDELSNG